MSVGRNDAIAQRISPIRNIDREFGDDVSVTDEGVKGEGGFIAGKQADAAVDELHGLIERQHHLGRSRIQHGTVLRCRGQQLGMRGRCLRSRQRE